MSREFNFNDVVYVIQLHVNPCNGVEPSTMEFAASHTAREFADQFGAFKECVFDGNGDHLVVRLGDKEFWWTKDTNKFVGWRKWPGLMQATTLSEHPIEVVCPVISEDREIQCIYEILSSMERNVGEDGTAQFRVLRYLQDRVMSAERRKEGGA